MSSFRHAASRITKKIGCAMGASLALLIAIYLPAAANAAVPETQAAPTQEPVVSAPVPAPAKVSAELAVCPRQTFLQPFTHLNHTNHYTHAEAIHSPPTR